MNAHNSTTEPIRDIRLIRLIQLFEMMSDARSAPRIQVNSGQVGGAAFHIRVFVEPQRSPERQRFRRHLS